MRLCVLFLLYTFTSTSESVVNPTQASFGARTRGAVSRCGFGFGLGGCVVRSREEVRSRSYGRGRGTMGFRAKTPVMRAVGDEQRLLDGQAKAYGSSGHPLENTSWKMQLDIGREKNTWMPPQWAASGRRMEINMLVTFKPGGLVYARIGPYLDMNVTGGTWKLNNDILRFSIKISGFEKFDVSLPEGDLFFACGAWGDMLCSRQKNNILTIKARRFFIREEKRMVGTFRADRVGGEEEGEQVTLPPCRTSFRRANDEFYDDDL